MATRDELDRIRAALEAAAGVGADRIELDADADAVVLRGAVATPEEATEAGMLAEQHVDNVRNELRVDPNLREDPTLSAPEQGPQEADDVERGTQLQTQERGGEIVEDVQESLDENIAWTPPDEPTTVPTAAEQRGFSDHRIATPDSADAGPLDEDEAAEADPSLADLSPEDLRHAAHPSPNDEERR